MGVLVGVEPKGMDPKAGVKPKGMDQEVGGDVMGKSRVGELLRLARELGRDWEELGVPYSRSDLMAAVRYVVLPAVRMK